MTKFILVAAALMALAATIPASAQVYFDAGLGGVGVEVDNHTTVGITSIVAMVTTPTTAVTAEWSVSVLLPPADA